MAVILWVTQNNWGNILPVLRTITWFSSCPQSFPASRSFPMSRWSFSFSSSSSKNIQGWFPLELIGLISLKPKGPSRVFSSATVWKHQFFSTPLVLMVQLSHLYMTTGKTIALTIWIFVSKVTSLLFSMLSRFIIAFLPRSKCRSISWLLSPSAMTLEPKKIVCHCFHCFPIYLPWSGATGCHLCFLNVEF